jgi:uncharacterized membrane protein
MTNIQPSGPDRLSFLPRLQSRWWSLVLGLSLMLNLLVGGIVLGGVFGHGRSERLAGISYVQLMPRNFLQQLPRERRATLMQIVRDNREDLRALRKVHDGNSLKLADVLEKETFSIEDVRQAVTAFSTGTESLAARGGEVVVKIVSELSPDERKLLAKAIRDRDSRANSSKRP